MSWTMEGVRDKVASLLSTYGIKQSYAVAVPAPVTPCTIVTPVTGMFATRPVMDDDVRDLHFTVLVLVSKTVDEYAQNVLDDHISPDGVWDALESGTVASTWDYCTPTGQTGYGQYVFGSGDAAQAYLGFTTNVTVGVS